MNKALHHNRQEGQHGCSHEAQWQRV